MSNQGQSTQGKSTLTTPAMIDALLAAVAPASAMDDGMDSAIAAGKKLGAVQLSVARYEQRRKEILAGLGAESVPGGTSWPPTSQSIMHRFGLWNQALTAAGLAPGSGRAPGQLKFDAADYHRAVSNFLADCSDRQAPATFSEYTAYATERKGQVPSAAAVRKFYGSWNAALDSCS